jgi:putative protein-disulfide isomerase
VTAKPEVIYVGDPMCSWCWGLAPSLHEISKRNDVEMRVVVGGLRPGPSAETLDDRMRAVLAHHWDKVAAVSNQPFDHAFLDKSGWVYDTELPAIAVTTMRQRAPLETLRFFTDLQRAFYADGVDITDLGSYPELISGYDVENDEFLAEMTSPEARTRAWNDFAEARELGVLGFPTVLLRVEGGTQLLSRGYAPFEHFEDQLGYWVEGRLPVAADVGKCSVSGGDC